MVADIVIPVAVEIIVTIIANDRQQISIIGKISLSTEKNNANFFSSQIQKFIFLLFVVAVDVVRIVVVEEAISTISIVKIEI